MAGFMMFLHAFISIFLVVVILMQSGRGGGLTEQFASAESMFGAQTNEFMIKATTVLATIFLLTSLGLAVLSAQKGKSLMAGAPAPISEEDITAADDIVIPDVQEGSVAVSEVEKIIDQAENITIETGAQEVREGAAEVIPENAPEPKTEPADVIPEI